MHADEFEKINPVDTESVLKMVEIQHGNQILGGCCLKIDSNRGFCSPDSGKTSIDFAVPSDQIIQNYKIFLSLFHETWIRP